MKSKTRLSGCVGNFLQFFSNHLPWDRFSSWISIVACNNQHWTLLKITMSIFTASYEKGYFPIVFSMLRMFSMLHTVKNSLSKRSDITQNAGKLLVRKFFISIRLSMGVFLECSIVITAKCTWNCFPKIW